MDINSISTHVQIALSMIAVAAIWGCTNPFMRKAEGEPPLTLKWAVAFGINQLGSLLYYLLLGSTAITLAVPVCNSLTFVFTAITAWLIGERDVNTGRPFRCDTTLMVGCTLVVAGVAICVSAPVLRHDEYA